MYVIRERMFRLGEDSDITDGAGQPVLHVDGKMLSLHNRLILLIGTRPEIAEDTMRECAELGIKQVWMHRAPGTGSVSDAATGYGRQHGITVIDGGCPLMFGPTADFGHKMMRLVLSGHVPKQV